MEVHIVSRPWGRVMCVCFGRGATGPGHLAAVCDLLAAVIGAFSAQPP
jgi:hypothetical protein